MKLAILFIAVASTAWAQTQKNVERPIRAPQRQIKYSELDGSKVNWRYVAPQTQWRSQRAEGGSSLRLRQTQQEAPQQHRTPAPQPQQQQVQQLQPISPQQFYRPYSSVPTHIKQLIETTYQSQAPYVDPSSFLYNTNYVAPEQYQQQQQPAQAASELPYSAYLRPSERYQSIDPQAAQSAYNEYNERRVERQDRILYRDNYEQQQQQQQQQEQQQQQQQQQPIYQIARSPLAAVPEPPAPVLYLDKNMPSEIKQLLQYQAQIPYDVTANRIQYTPKNVFIPQPLSDDVKGPYYYRSKVYYANDNVEPKYSQDKPVEEDRQ
ncbi:GATA zinc finger domain-containing protein 10-like [Pseudomyrmex gracilis]|uniref:GATA zinc finger domain-containing protein 10-like n=1 Tax=Pseudomyrmex gracilis TaxID=219809 RepID=UPI0009955E5C|nr:GATA zinc finger domain-containing protein 10-like [Pseudomyrmex gracilis]